MSLTAKSFAKRCEANATLSCQPPHFPGLRESASRLTGAILGNPEHRTPQKGIVAKADLQARESCLHQLPPGETVTAVPASLAPVAPMRCCQFLARRGGDRAYDGTRSQVMRMACVARNCQLFLSVNFQDQERLNDKESRDRALQPDIQQTA